MATPARAPSVVVHQLPTLWDQLTTPQLLKLGVVSVWLTTLLLTLVTVAGVHQHRQALQTIGKDSAPSIIAAQKIKAALADMDANAANELLLPATQANSKPYEESRKTLGRTLVEAAKNITYREEREPIETLAVELGNYDRQAQQARDLRESNSAKSLLAYRAAAATMDNVLLPAAAALDSANSSVLDPAYQQQQRESGFTVFIFWAAGVVLLGVLAGLQLFFVQRMRRLLNPFLLLATAILLIFMITATRQLTHASHELRVAKEDAFESMRALSTARADGYRANAAESRYLLDAADPARAQGDENDFQKLADNLIKLPSGVSLQELAAAGWGTRMPDGATGLLAAEMKNITFGENEREPAMRALAAWAKYVNIDKAIRQLEQSKQHQRAIDLCLGTGPDQSNGAFLEFDNAVRDTLDVNQREFDRAISEGVAALDGLDSLTIAIALALAMLTFLGVRARLREYNR